MSYSIVVVNRNVWRKAVLLGKSGRICPLSGTATVRSSHSNLYQIIEKRSSEVHAKSQTNKFSRNNPHIIQTKQLCSSSRIPSIACAMIQEDMNKLCDSRNASKCNPGQRLSFSTDTAQRNEPKSDQYTAKSHQNIIENTESSHESAGPPPPSSPIYIKILAALLAGLGLGGLIYWYLSEPEVKKEEKPTVPILKSTDLPKHIPYLLIGGGSASFSAFRAIKSNDPTARILMITNEHRKPYMRPPLSKELWYTAQSGEITKDYRFKQWTGSERSLYFEPDEFFVDPKNLLEAPNGGIAVAEGFTVKRIDPQKKVAILADGYEISYDNCLIATGCTPKNLPVFRNAPANVKEKVMVYRTPDDFERLKHYADQKKSITIIGNGFIGSELACSLANYGKEKGIHVQQIYEEAGNMSKIIPEYLSRWTTKKIEDLGVKVLPKSRIHKAEIQGNQLKLHLKNGNTILTDIAVVCVGCSPNTSFAEASRLEVDETLGGFLVNAELEARRNLFVAGDASCFYDPLLGRRRVEHHDHSIVSGRLAGENMVGMKKPYTHQSMFWSDLGPDIGYEGIGLVDSSLQTVGVFAISSPQQRTNNNLDEKDKAAQTSPEKKVIVKEPSKPTTPATTKPLNAPSPQNEDYGRGVVFYLKDEKVVGILLWNLFNRTGLARTIINQNKKYDDLNEVAKLFEIHS